MKTLDAIDTVTRYIKSDDASVNTLDAVFSNRVRIPWVKDPPHPLLQLSIPMGTRGVEYHTVFHDLLMNYYGNYSINGATLFPCAGMIEIGLAAGMKMRKKSSP